MSRHGAILAAGHDADLNVSALTLALAGDDFGAPIRSFAQRFAGSIAAGRAFRVELLSDDPVRQPGDESLRAIAVELHGEFSASIYVGRRTVPVSAWAFVRPMPWGRRGLAVGQTSPMLPFGEAACHGVAVEVGAPSVLFKVRLENLPEEGLLRACNAVSGPESGFIDVAAYPAASAADGTATVAMEFGDGSRSLLSRGLAVLEIEAQRYGGRLGQAALLSHVPLESLLAVLRARTGLSAHTGQVLETHLPRQDAVFHRAGPKE
ncbi:MAG: hypothetical protein GIW99_07080 [Candidatus Eremiobacteraeota bacterium]|nr:hypothetical protein [Candidatus Eremiobacteraeota bacterium]MBC5827427.1 hypothetical protein [Candidatus Eremiobacteraeota bacterium]